MEAGYFRRCSTDCPHNCQLTGGETMTESAERDSSNTPRVNRRRALTALGGAGLGAAGVVMAGRMAADASTPPAASGPKPACVLAPETIEGPYYLDYELFRSDITEGK